MHLERRLARINRMALTRNRRPEHGHHPIAHEAAHCAPIVLHCFAHALCRAIEQVVGFLRIELLGECSRARDVGKEHRNRLSFAGMTFPCGENFVGLRSHGIAGQGDRLFLGQSCNRR